MIDAILAEARTVSWRRRAPDTFTDGGKAVLGQITPEDILATVQPATGKLLADLPEGLRTGIRWFMWTPADVKQDEEVAFDGITYRITQIWPRRADGFTKASLGGGT